MEQRLNFYKASPNATKVLMVLETALHKLSIEPLLVDLVKLRASQINGCAYCVDMHTRDARKKGETERRLYGVSVWHETPFFDRGAWDRVLQGIEHWQRRPHSAPPREPR
jgi:AhpD family alkylhydroperoxidase